MAIKATSESILASETPISERFLKISRTTRSVTTSNCLPIEFENDSGIALINSYTSYARIIENGVPVWLKQFYGSIFKILLRKV